MSDDRFLPTYKEFIREHLVWILSLFPFVLAGLKLLVISGGNSEVFRFLLQDLNLVKLLMSTVVPLLPVTVFWAYVIIVDWLISTPRENRRWLIADWIAVPLFGAGFIPILYMPSAQLIGNVGLLLFLIVSRLVFRWIARIVQKRGKDPGTLDHPRSDYLQMFMLGVTAAVFYAPTPWLPSEVVLVGNSNHTGYVLSTTDWTTILESNKTVSIFRTSDVKSRTPCEPDNWAAKPIFEIWPKGLKRFPCPDLP